MHKCSLSLFAFALHVIAGAINNCAIRHGASESSEKEKKFWETIIICIFYGFLDFCSSYFSRGDVV